MSKKHTFRITRTVDADTLDESITVEDMEKEKEEEVIDTGETYDAAEIKEVSDMCKDMGYESIKDMAIAAKDMKKKMADMEKEDPDEKEKKEKTGDEDPEAAEVAKKKNEANKKTSDAALAALEVSIAGLKDAKAKEDIISLVSKVKDSIKGYTVAAEDASKKIFQATAKDEELAKKQPDFDMDEYFSAQNAQNLKGGE